MSQSISRNRQSIVAAAFAALLALAGPGMAQTAAPAPAAPTATPASPAALAAARDVVTGSGLSRSFETYVPQYMDQLKRSILTTRPEIGKELTEVMEALKPEFESQKDEMITTAARIYALRMSEADLREAAAFFKTPGGQRYVQAQPQVLDDLFGQMQVWTQRLSELMVGRVRTELKKKNVEM
jgi:hypothetical protein